MRPRNQFRKENSAKLMDPWTLAAGPERLLPLVPQPIVPLLLLLLLLLIIPCNHFSSDNEKEKGEVMILLFGGKVAGYSSN